MVKHKRKISVTNFILGILLLSTVMDLIKDGNYWLSCINFIIGCLNIFTGTINLDED